MTEVTCPFCGEPDVRQRHGHWALYRCGTRGPDEEGNYATGRVCDITRYTAEIERLQEQHDFTKEVERLRAENERRHDRIKQLMAAIEEHRLDVWGTGPIGRDRDAELYAVLESEVSDERSY